MANKDISIETKCPACGKKVIVLYKDLGYVPKHFRITCGYCGTRFTNSYPSNEPQIQTMWENGESF